jgi:hypothetical protein
MSHTQTQQESRTSRPIPLNTSPLLAGAISRSGPLGPADRCLGATVNSEDDESDSGTSIFSRPHALPGRVMEEVNATAELHNCKIS